MTFWDEIGKDIACVLGIIIITPLIVLLFAAGWISSCKSASIYNDRNDTHYSCSDFFWASSQINSQTQTIKLTD